MRQLKKTVLAPPLWLKVTVLGISLGSWLAVSNGAQQVPFALPLLWPENQRAFLQDGPGLLLSAAERAQFVAQATQDREAFITAYLAQDPLPDTPENELTVGIEHRRALVEGASLSFIDDRAAVLFLHGPPASLKSVDCGETFRPIEIWRYSQVESAPALVFYQPKPRQPFKLWLPVDSKRVLYSPEMEYWLDQWDELRSRIIAPRRIDLMSCEQAEEIDRATGVDGLYGFAPDRPKNADIQAFLAPPAELSTWARQAAATAVPPPKPLGEGELELLFPERHGLRMQTRMLVILRPGFAVTPFVEESTAAASASTPEVKAAADAAAVDPASAPATPPAEGTGGKKELRLRVEGQLEREGAIFDVFRFRYLLSPPEEAVPLALIADRALRPGQEFLLRLRVVDEISGNTLRFNRGFVVPSSPTALEEPPVPEAAIIALGEELQQNRVSGRDSLLLVPPATDVVFGLWRAETLVTGERIQKVIFYLDGKPQMSRQRPPFTAELRLEVYPTEQIVRVEGYDAQDVLVAADEVVLNQPRGELRVRIVEPRRGNVGSGKVRARAEVVVPEERTVSALEFRVDEVLQVRLEQPPWEAEIEVPESKDLSYLTVTAELDDGSKAEDVRFLNAPDFIDEVAVDLVELYTSVTDDRGQLVRGLVQTDFKVWEDSKPQQISKFELVENLPLTIGVTIDTSGSMIEALGEAQRAAVDFLESIVTPKDRCFALAFADRPELLMERTSDVGAVAQQLRNLVASGATALHDAVVTSLYYFRGVKGRRALVLLSDGEDTSSRVAFRDALEYAKRSGVAIYTIGLGISKFDVGVRRKLENLADETGGRTFYIKESVELAPIYEQIEADLRSQYLVAYNSNQGSSSTEYRTIELKVKDGKLKGRTLRGYYP